MFFIEKNNVLNKERVAYKLAVTFYRCLHGLAPSYLAQSIRRVAELDRRRLRSSSSDDIIIPTIRLVTVGSCFHRCWQTS